MLAVAVLDGVTSETLTVQVTWDAPATDKPIDPDKPITWRREHKFQITLESYNFLERAKNLFVSASGIKISVTGDRWAELTLHEGFKLDADALRLAADTLRKHANEGQLGIEVTALHFQRGQAFLDWIEQTKAVYQSAEVRQ